jgi:catechol 2,3-dioxygenase-like lactoylglutathione lyase family enzyme
MNLNQVTLPALNVAESVAFYKRMGFELVVDSPHYARFKCPQGEASFSVQHVDAVPKSSEVVVYFEDAALDQTVKELQARGIRFTQEPRDEPWLWREARTQDPSGNVICLYWAGANRLYPPWRVGAPAPAKLKV